MRRHATSSFRNGLARPFKFTAAKSESEEEHARSEFIQFDTRAYSGAAQRFASNGLAYAAYGGKTTNA